MELRRYVSLLAGSSISLASLFTAIYNSNNNPYATTPEVQKHNLMRQDVANLDIFIKDAYNDERKRKLEELREGVFSSVRILEETNNFRVYSDWSFRHLTLDDNLELASLIAIPCLAGLGVTYLTRRRINQNTHKMMEEINFLPNVS